MRAQRKVKGALAAPTNFNASTRNAFRGPDYFNTDLNLKKSFALTESVKSRSAPTSLTS